MNEIEEIMNLLNSVSRLIELKKSNEIQEFYYSDEFSKVIDIAINAIEKQIPKKPIYDNYHRAGYRCPNCNNINPWGYEHCRYCGQNLDWSEREYE